MFIAQFSDYYAVDEKWVNTFLFYDTEARLHRLEDDYFEKRTSSYKKLLENVDQENKNTFRLQFIMG